MPEQKLNSHTFYLVFIENKNTKLKISTKEKALMRKTARKIYYDNGINMDVQVLTVSEPFSEKEIGQMDTSEKLTYLSDTTTFKELKLGFSISPGFTSPNTKLGYYDYTNWLDTARAKGSPMSINEMNPDGVDMDKLDKKYDKLQYNTPNPYSYSVDYITWIARDAIHEGGGHGELGTGHSDEGRCEGNSPDCRIPERYGQYGVNKQNIMLKGTSAKRTPYPKEINPDVLKYLPVDIQKLRELHPYFENPYKSYRDYLSWDPPKHGKMIVPNDEFGQKMKSSSKVIKTR